jgi:outer membrane protein assembly factor BamB/predicted phosphodiesterase
MVMLISLSGCSNPQSDSLKFAFLTDIHVTPGSANAEMLRLVVDEINGSDADLIVITGDLTNAGSDAELELVKSILDSLQKTYLVIPGNHETNWSESGGLKITELWDDDRFLHESGNFLLAGFSTGPYMKMSDGHVKREDIQWLGNELTRYKGKSKKLLVFAHYPLAEGLDNWFDVTDLLKEHNALVVFCGHGHRLGLHNFDGIPGIMGRALMQGSPPVAGYNIVEVRNDSLFVSEKLLGNDTLNRVISFSLTNPVEISSLPVSSRPDYSVNDQYPDVFPSYEWNDTASILAGVCLVGDSLFVYANSLGWIKAVNHIRNSIIWQKRFSGSVFSTPAVAGDAVVFGSLDGNIYGLDVSNGDILWSVDAGTPVLASPLADGSDVYIGGGTTAFYRIDASTGDIIWSFDGIDGLVQGKPALSGDNVVFGVWDRHLYNLSSATGDLKWKWNNGRVNELFSPGNIVPVISSGRVFIVAPDRYMTAIDIVTGKEAWRTAKHQVRESMGISPDGSEVFAKLMNDSIVSVSATTRGFQTLWAVDAGIGYDHNPCPLLSDDNIVIGATKNGLVTAIDRKSKSVAWMHKTGNSSVNNLVFDKFGNIWLSLPEGKIIKLANEGISKLAN